jgi:hypothetical protein
MAEIWTHKYGLQDLSSLHSLATTLEIPTHPGCSLLSLSTEEIWTGLTAKGNRAFLANRPENAIQHVALNDIAERNNTAGKQRPRPGPPAAHRWWQWVSTRRQAEPGSSEQVGGPCCLTTAGTQRGAGQTEVMGDTCLCYLPKEPFADPTLQNLIVLCSYTFEHSALKPSPQLRTLWCPNSLWWPTAFPSLLTSEMQTIIS